MSGALKSLALRLDLVACIAASGRIVYTTALTTDFLCQLIAEASTKIFVPLTVGGGIRSFTDSNGVSYTALQVHPFVIEHACRTCRGDASIVQPSNSLDTATE